MSTPQAAQLLDQSRLMLRDELPPFSPSSLESTEQTLGEMLVLVRRRMNRHAPISRLPVELLVCIFNIVCERTKDSKPTSYPRPLVVLTHVCYRWRHAALECHSLWVNIEAGSPSALVCAERAEDLPLNVSLSLDDSDVRVVKQRKILKRLSSRVTCLSLMQTSLWARELPPFGRILAALTPSLSFLRIVILSNAGFQRVHSQILFPTSGSKHWIPARVATSLKSTVLDSPHPLFPALSCPALTALNVVFRSEDSFESFTVFLRGTPTLEDLEATILLLRTDDLPDFRARPSLPPPASLPRLRRLRIAMPGFAADLTPFNLVPASRAAAAHTTSMATTRAPEGSRGSAPWAVGNLVLDVNTDRMRYHVSGHSAPSSNAALPVSAVLRFPWENLRWWKGSWRDVPTTPARPWFAEDVKALRLTVGCHASPSALGARLGGLPSLEKMVIRAQTYRDVLPQLCAFLTQPSASAGGCPALRTLVLSLLHTGCALEDMRPLFDALERRAVAGGRPLQNLALCTPLHAGPDYAVYGLRGVRWTTFSSADAGSSSADASEWADSDLAGRSVMSYDGAWVAYASHRPSRGLFMYTGPRQARLGCWEP
ncbi:hypothetical protein FKP32DRAFT_1671636 [Trametes sanguinea]|nr:hypothetical protein FKP32DRAFT_1671636 [Trametes sanguinea]